MPGGILIRPGIERYALAWKDTPWHEDTPWHTTKGNNNVEYGTVRCMLYNIIKFNSEIDSFY